jgi:hypothetical protein
MSGSERGTCESPDRASVAPLFPEFNPIEFFWRNLKKHTTHLRYFPTFDKLVEKVDSKLRYFAELPSAIKAVMGRYCETVGQQ